MNLKNSYLHPLLNGLVILLLLWLAGFVLFTRDVADVPAGDIKNPAYKADGIVVLTGGSERMEAGFDLLLNHAAPRLLISGVDDRVAPEKMLPRILPDNHPARGLKECCITFGTYAEDTYGNAVETAAWAEKNGIKKIIMVTANYHMRRSLAVFHQVLKGVTIIPFAVQPDHVKMEAWWDYPGTASLLMGEYTKLLLAYAQKIFSL